MELIDYHIKDIHAVKLSYSCWSAVGIWCMPLPIWTQDFASTDTQTRPMSIQNLKAQFLLHLLPQFDLLDLEK